MPQQIDPSVLMFLDLCLKTLPESHQPNLYKGPDPTELQLLRGDVTSARSMSKKGTLTKGELVTGLINAIRQGKTREAYTAAFYLGKKLTEKDLLDLVFSSVSKGRLLDLQFTFALRIRPSLALEHTCLLVKAILGKQGRSFAQNESVSPNKTASLLGEYFPNLEIHKEIAKQNAAELKYRSVLGLVGTTPVSMWESLRERNSARDVLSMTARSQNVYKGF